MRHWQMIDALVEQDPDLMDDEDLKAIVAVFD
ncbi:hypothetical protein ABH940_003370 [Streptacidiphilus sp. BW17]